MKKIIGVDLDEVLAEFFDYALAHHDYKICGKTIKKEDIVDCYIYKMPDFDLEVAEAYNWFRTPLIADNSKLDVKPVLGAIDGLIKFKEKGYILKIVTARVSDLFGEYTSKWVNKHYPDIFEDIIFANHSSLKEDKPKSELCKEHGIFHMIEDNPDYALDLAENGIITYLLEKPWNILRKETHENLIKVKSWEEINF